MSLRVGIVGTGWVAQDRHIPSFRAHPAAQIVAVYDRDRRRAEELAGRAHIARACADLGEFLSQGLDLVSIATPPWTHAQLASAALEAGAHVFTEKPMAMDLGEARSMVEAAAAADRLLCVSHNLLFSRAVAKARRLLGSDPDLLYAGGVQLSSLRRRLPTWYPDLPGGLLFDEIPHLIYLLQDFVGPLEVEHVRARWTSGGSALRSVEVLLGGRAPAQITMVLDAPLSEWQVVLVNSRGVVALDLFRDIAVRLGPDNSHQAGDILRTSAAAVTGHLAGFVSSGARYTTGRLRWGHDVLIHRFVQAVLGRGSIPISFDDALGVVAVADQIVARLQGARPHEIP